MVSGLARSASVGQRLLPVDHAQVHYHGFDPFGSIGKTKPARAKAGRRTTRQEADPGQDERRVSPQEKKKEETANNHAILAVACACVHGQERRGWMPGGGWSPRPAAGQRLEGGLEDRAAHLQSHLAFFAERGHTVCL